LGAHENYFYRPIVSSHESRPVDLSVPS